MIDLNQLRIFTSVCETNSFTQSAVAMGVAQPTVSRIIKEMEEDWGGQLFYRTGRGVTLSELGEVARNRAQALLQEADQFAEDMRAFSREPKGMVSLGVSPSLAPTLVPAFVNDLKENLPGIRLSIREGFSDQIERWRVAGAVDVGIFSNFRTLDGEGDVDTTPALFASNLVLVAPATGAPLPAQVQFDDLEKYPLAMPAAPNGLRNIFEDIARRRNMFLDVAIESNSLVVQKQLCLGCGCFLIKAPETIEDEIDAGIYQASPICDPSIQRYLQLSTTQQRPLSRAAREVASRMTAILKRLSPQIADRPMDK